MADIIMGLRRVGWTYPASYELYMFASNSYPGSLVTIHLQSIVPIIADDAPRHVVYGSFEGSGVDIWHQNHLEPVTGGRFKVLTW